VDPKAAAHTVLLRIYTVSPLTSKIAM
jgi:hypothetical protein